MAFSFGASAQPQAQVQPTSSLFGGTNQAVSTSASSPFGGFGATANTQPAATASTGLGSFGGATNAGVGSSGTSLFGQQAKPAGGLFGSGTAAPASTPAGGTGLFGSNTAAQNTGGGLFGSTATQPQQQQGGGLFGSTTAQPQQQSGGLFGSAANTQQTGGLFGSTGQKPAGTGLFGSATAQPAAGGSLFGSTAQPQQATGGLFGASTAQPAQQSSLFASKPAGGLFGSTAQPQQSTGLFGSTAQLPQQSMFASTSQPLAQSIATPQGQGQGQDIESKIVAIKNAWDDNSPECRFKYFFYNVVDPGTSQAYGRPISATDDTKWLRAMRDNPDPQNMVPVLATGWKDVKKRVEMQEQAASVHQQRIKELNQALANLSRQTSLSSSVRLQSLQTQLSQLTQRLLALAAKSPSFAPVQSSVFRPEEGEMKHTLEEVKDALDGRTKPSRGVGLGTQRSATKGRMLGQVNELWGMVEEVRRQRRVRGHDAQVWAGDEKLLAEIAIVLDQQQAALSKLSELAGNSVFDADVMRVGLASMEKS
ncbi:hypothetical protein CspeluHIS016_0210140 [Cutaneotrichosporon spelunceum]|uniref:Nucleoporin Nup54 alpha-helical domain-containing protein n=1 Tax=Cutaneotrichosporon spelunceum TaxID=1672016 RepID=A0AAD3YBC5_9TREE|nr:hypothetical protein CspeluHIS016_0210140 [Cutaneotrichosporon spelunceum]